MPAKRTKKPEALDGGALQRGVNTAAAAYFTLLERSALLGVVYFIADKNQWVGWAKLLVGLTGFALMMPLVIPVMNSMNSFHDRWVNHRWLAVPATLLTVLVIAAAGVAAILFAFATAKTLAIAVG